MQPMTGKVIFLMKGIFALKLQGGGICCLQKQKQKNTKKNCHLPSTCGGMMQMFVRCLPIMVLGPLSMVQAHYALSLSLFHMLNFYSIASLNVMQVKFIFHGIS